MSAVKPPSIPFQSVCGKTWHLISHCQPVRTVTATNVILDSESTVCVQCIHCLEQSRPPHTISQYCIYRQRLKIRLYTHRSTINFFRGLEKCRLKKHTLLFLYLFIFTEEEKHRERQRERERESERERGRGESQSQSESVSLFVRPQALTNGGTITFVLINIICGTPLELCLSSLLFFYNHRMQMGNSDMITQWS